MLRTGTKNKSVLDVSIELLKSITSINELQNITIEELINIKALEAMAKIAEGPANKVFIPFDATSALGSLGAIKEVMNEDKKAYAFRIRPLRRHRNSGFHPV